MTATIKDTKNASPKVLITSGEDAPGIQIISQEDDDQDI